MLSFYQLLESIEPKAPKVLMLKPIINDYAKANVDFEEYREWYEDVLEIVPIDKIPFNPWHPGRLKDNLEKIGSTKQMPPIEVYFDDKTNEYSLSDGNHRTAASKELGYTHVPAIVSHRRTYPPPIDRKTSAKRMERAGWDVAYAIKKFKSVDGFDVKSNAKGFVLEITTLGDNDDKEYRYEVSGKRTGAVYRLVLTMKSPEEGKPISIRGELPVVAQEIATNVVGIGER